MLILFFVILWRIQGYYYYPNCKSSDYSRVFLKQRIHIYRLNVSNLRVGLIEYLLARIFFWLDLIIYIRFTILHHGLVRAVSLPPLGVDPGGGYFIYLEQKTS